MNAVIEVPGNEAAPVESSPDVLLRITYCLYGVGLVLGPALLAGVIISHIMGTQAQNGLIRSHYRWLRRTFWFWLLWTAISIPLAFIVIGYVTGLAAWIWMVCRVIRGAISMQQRKAMPVPGAQ